MLDLIDWLTGMLSDFVWSAKGFGMKKTALILAVCVGISSGIQAQPTSSPWWANKWIVAGIAGATFGTLWIVYKSFFKNKSKTFEPGDLSDLSGSEAPKKESSDSNEKQNKNILVAQFRELKSESLYGFVDGARYELVRGNNVLTLSFGDDDADINTIQGDRSWKYDTNVMVSNEWSESIKAGDSDAAELRVFKEKTLSDRAKTFTHIIIARSAVLSNKNAFTVSPSILKFITSSEWRTIFPNVTHVFITSLSRGWALYKDKESETGVVPLGLFYFKK